MADFASQILGIASQTVQNQPDLVGAVKSGADLAQHVSNIQAQRAQIEQQKQEMLLNKITKIGSMYESAGKLEGRAQRFMYDKAIPNTIKALGVEQFYPESTQAMLSSSPSAVPYLISQVRQHPEKMDSILQALQDPSGEALAAMYPEIQKFGALGEIVTDAKDSVGKLEDAQKWSMSEEGKFARSKLQADAAAGRQETQLGAVGESEAKKDVAKAWSTWETGGGLTNRRKAETIFQSAIEQLKKGEVQFGTMFKNIPWVGSNEDVLAVADKKAKKLLDDIRGGISIKEKTGDPNPTAQQINAIMARAIDPRLTNQQNIDKLQTELNAMRDDTANKVRVFRQYGHMPQPAGERGKKEVDEANNKPKKRFRDFGTMQQDLIVNAIAKQTGRKDLDKIREEEMAKE